MAGDLSPFLPLGSKMLILLSSSPTLRRCCTSLLVSRWALKVGGGVLSTHCSQHLLCGIRRIFEVERAEEDSAERMKCRSWKGCGMRRWSKMKHGSVWQAGVYEVMGR